MSGKEEDLRNAQISFMGGVVASATHEFMNHLAVINEYNGLLGDLLKNGRSRANVKRCVEISDMIEGRAAEASRLIDALNRFSHRGDKPSASFKVNDIVGEAAVLLQRTAYISRKTLAVDPAENNLVIINDACLLEYLLYTLAVPYLDESKPEIMDVSISTQADDEGEAEITIRATPAAGSQEDYAANDVLATCLEKLGASLDRRTTPDAVVISVSIRSLSAGI